MVTAPVDLLSDISGVRNHSQQETGSWNERCWSGKPERGPCPAGTGTCRGAGQHSARGGLKARGGRQRFLGLMEPDPRGHGVGLQVHFRSTVLLGFLRTRSRASLAARRVCLTTSTPAHIQMCKRSVTVLHGCLCCALSCGGEVPTRRSKVLVPPLGGWKPAAAQLMVSQAHGQKGKGSKLTQGAWFFCRSRNLRQTSLVSEQAAV